MLYALWSPASHRGRPPVRDAPDTDAGREVSETVHALMSCKWSTVMRMKAWLRLRLHKWRQRASASAAAAKGEEE